MDVVTEDSACISATVPQSKEDRIFVTDSSSNNNYKNENVDMIRDNIQTQEQGRSVCEEKFGGFPVGCYCQRFTSDGNSLFPGKFRYS